MCDWNSALYSKFIVERTQPAIDLALHIDADPKTVLDIGCGSAKSRAVLVKRFPHAKVTGIDSSPDMIKSAKKNCSEADFFLCDVNTEFDKIEKYDVIFSNACIQWLPDHEKKISEFFSHLNEGGVLGIQVPDNYNESFHTIITKVVNSEKWAAHYDKKGREVFILISDEYFNILSHLSDNFNIWRTTYFHRMASYQAMIEWYSSTGLRPYLSELDEKEASDFLSDIENELKIAYPIQENGEIIFRFSRLFFLIKK